MSSRVLNALFGPRVPTWACELTPRQVVVVGASANRRGVRARALEELEPGALVPDLKVPNVVSTAAVRGALGRSLEKARFSGSEIVVVVPDDSVRLALVDVESFPSAEEEQRAFIRWKFKKSVPFEVGSARVTWDKVGVNGTIRLIAALTPEAVIRQYEEVAESFGLHAGVVLPSTLAALGLIGKSDGDVMFVKKSATGITTSVLVGGNMRFYRKVPLQPLYEAVYPTFVYYQDKSLGSGLSQVVQCGEDVDPDEVAELEQGLGVRCETLLSADIEDVFKPALGALQT